MNRVDKLKAARRNYSVIWSNFVNNYAKKPDILYCFFEGEDVKYYGIRIDLAIRNERENLICRGKEGVLHLYKLVSSSIEHKLAWVAFFIDQDFDELTDFPTDPRIFLTPCYSVENFYVTITAFEKIMRDEFQISNNELHDDLKNIMQIYETRLNEFNLVSEELNIWIMLQRDFERNGTLNGKLNLADIKIGNLFNISLAGIQKSYNQNFLSNNFSITPYITNELILNKTNSLKDVNRTLFFRGKFIIEFLRIVLEQIKQDRNHQSPKYFSQSGKVKINISRQNFLSELSQYADTPEELSDFLVRLSSNKKKKNRTRKNKFKLFFSRIFDFLNQQWIRLSSIKFI